MKMGLLTFQVRAAAEARDLILEKNGGVAPQPGHKRYDIYQMAVKDAQGVRIIGGRAIWGQGEIQPMTSLSQ